MVLNYVAGHFMQVQSNFRHFSPVALNHCFFVIPRARTGRYAGMAVPV